MTETAPPIERITTGVDRAWVRLAAGAAGNLEASFTPAGDSAERTVAVSSGQRDIRLEGLSALTSYDLRIGRGPAARRSRFQTLEKGPGSFIRLTERRFEARGLELRSGPGCVGAIWRQSRPGRGQQIRFSQSFDGGQTWTASEAAGDVKSSTSWPSLERAATGFVAAWRETSRGSGCKVEVRARPDATGRWESLGGFGSSEHEPALAVGGDDALELLAWRPARGHAAEGIDWRRIDRARNTSGPAARAGSLVHQHAFVRCCQAVRLGGLLCCFYTSLVSPTELQGLTIAGVGSIDPALPELRWISSSMPEKGIWSAPQAIAPINEKFRGTPEVRALANRLVVCYEAGDEVACRVLLVPGQPPGAAVNPFGAKHPGECPSLFRSGGSLRLAALARVAGSGRGGTAASTDLLEAVSPDGVHWRPAGQRRLTGPRLSALRVAASESGTVALGVDEEGALFVLR